MSLGGGLRSPDPISNADCLVQDTSPFAIASPDTVDQRRSERDEGLHLKRTIVQVVRVGDRLSQEADRGIDGSCIKGTHTCLETGNGRGLGRSPMRQGALMLWVRGLQHADARVGPELALEERDARISLDLGRSSITARDIRPDQKLLSILVERIGGDKPARKLRRASTVTRRYLCSRRLPEHALGRSGQPPSARQQPHIKARAGREGLALQEVTTKARHVDRLHPSACCQGVNVDECPVWQPENDRLAGNAGFVAEEPAQLG